MADFLTAEQVLAEVDDFCAANGMSTLGPHMRAAWEKDGKMPRAVLVFLKLRPVTVFERVA